jgi:hypothetical protein
MESEERAERILTTEGRLIATSVNTASVRDALGRLGLHDQRRMETAADPREYGVMISAFELVKLADRAEHLVVLERLVYGWWSREAGDPDDMRAEVIEWAGHHDFSMLDVAPPE